VVKKPAHVIEGAPDVGPRYRQADPHRTQDREVQADGAAIPRRRAYCLKPPDEATITWDHIIPISRGGTHSVGNLAPGGLPTRIQGRAASETQTDSLELTLLHDFR